MLFVHPENKWYKVLCVHIVNARARVFCFLLYFLTLFAINGVNAYIDVRALHHTCRTANFFSIIRRWSIWFDRFLFITLQFSTFSRLITLIDEFGKEAVLNFNAWPVSVRASICPSNISVVFSCYYNSVVFFR